MSGTTRIAWIDVGKGISILLVVLFHAGFFLVAHGISNDAYSFATWMFNPVRMPLFFAMAGVLATTAIQKDWPALAERKLWQFGYLFALWGSLHIVLFKYVLEQPYNSFDGPITQELLAGLVNPRTGIWFIWALIFYFAAAKLLRRTPLLAIGLSLTSTALFEMGYLADWGLTSVQQALFRYLPFFVIPALFGQTLVKQASGRPLVVLLCGVLLIGVSMMIPDFQDSQLDEGIKGVMRLLRGLCFGVGFTILISRLPLFREFFSYIGRHTLPIYLTHTPLLVGLMMIAASVTPPYFQFYGVLLISAVAVPLGLLFEKLVKRTRQGWLLQPLSLPRPVGSA